MATGPCCTEDFMAVEALSLWTVSTCHMPFSPESHRAKAGLEPSQRPKSHKNPSKIKSHTEAALGSYLLLKEQGVECLSARQDHHGEPHGHRHHEPHADHLRHHVGREVHQHVPSNGLGVTHVAKEAHLGRGAGLNSQHFTPLLTQGQDGDLPCEQP